MYYRNSCQRAYRYLGRAVFAFLFLVGSSAGIRGQSIIPQGTEKKNAQNFVAQSPDDTDDFELLRKGVVELTGRVEKLAKRVADLETERLFDITRVLLVGEEQRAETVQARLRENVERQAVLQVRLEPLDNQLKPENIERMFLGVGLTRPEEARDTMRRRLTAERQGILAQLELLRQERNRYQAALASSDLAIQRLRFRLNQIPRL